MHPDLKQILAELSYQLKERTVFKGKGYGEGRVKPGISWLWFVKVPEKEANRKE